MPLISERMDEEKEMTKFKQQVLAKIGPHLPTTLPALKDFCGELIISQNKFETRAKVNYHKSK
jgi:hypothetical protein